MSTNRKLAAIIFTDIVNYTKTMERDEQFALELLHKQREIFLPLIERHQDRLLKEIGDGTLMMFDSAASTFGRRPTRTTSRPGKHEPHWRSGKVNKQL